MHEMSVSIKAGAALEVPDLVWGAFRGSIDRAIGYGLARDLEDKTLVALAKAALQGETHAQKLDAWRTAFPAGAVRWPALWLQRCRIDQQGGVTSDDHDTLLSVLMVAATHKAWALYRASRERRSKITPFAMFSVSVSPSTADCEPHQGLYWPVAEAAVPWCRILECVEPFCTCLVSYTDANGLAARVALGWNVRAAGDDDL